MALWTSQREDHTFDWLRTAPISGLGQTMNDKTYRCVLCYRLCIPLFFILKPCSACSRVFAGDIYGDHAVSCAGIIGIKHRHNVVRDTLVDILVAYLEKSDDNTEFHQIVDFLSSFYITYALTVSPIFYASYTEQFWNTASSKTVNYVKQIHAIVDGKAVVISDALVRSDLLFDDEDGITCLTNDEIFENLALMGYEPLSTKLTFQKDLKKFLMYPRFLQLFLNKQLTNLPEIFNYTYETPCHTKKVFSNMARKSVYFSRNVTLLFDTMLVQHQAPEVEGSAIPPEPQPTPFTSQQPTSVSLTVETQTAEPQILASHIIFPEPPTKHILQSPTTYQRKRKTQTRKRTQKDTKLPQTSVSLNVGADEVVNQEEGDRVESAITTTASLEAAQDSGKPRRQETMGGTSAQTSSERVLEQPNDSPLTGVQVVSALQIVKTVSIKVSTVVYKLRLKRAKWDNDDYVYRGLILSVEDASSKKFLVINFTNYNMTDSRPVMKRYNELLGILGREELTLVELGSHLRIEESLRAKVTTQNQKMDDGFMEVTKKNRKGKHTSNSRHVDGEQSGMLLPRSLSRKLVFGPVGKWTLLKKVVFSPGLKIHYFDSTNGNTVAGPLVVNTVKHNNSSRYNDNKGKHKHHDNTRADPNKKAKPICWKCGKTGHIKRDCKGVNIGNKANGSAYFVQDDNVAWWADSRSIVHVCKDICWFKTYESLNDGSFLHMRNESTTLVHRRGCADIRLHIVNTNIAPAFMSTSKLNDSILWHARLVHVYFKRMQDMSKDGLIHSFDMDTKKCKTYMLTKITKRPFHNVKRKTKVLELIYNDLYDLHATPSLGNKKYFVTFIDDALRFCFVYLLHTKDEALDKFKVFKTKVELQQGSLIKRFRTDRREAISDEMDSILGNNTLVLADLPLRCKPLGLKLIFKRKLKYHKTTDYYGINSQLIIHQMDVKTTFLNGELDKDVYMNQPKGFIMPGNENKVDLTKKFLSSRISMKDMVDADVILVSTPMDTSEKLMPNNCQVVSQLEYSRVIGCLMYVMTCTRPDIAFVVVKLSRYTSNPVLEGYTDASWISHTKDNSSTSEWVLLLGGVAGKEAEWLRNLILEILWCQVYNGKSRHLGVRHSIIRELITNGVISLEFVRSQQKLADHLTKGLAGDLVIKFAEGMSLKSN
nr:zinc finger, CCHC-type [Tanacetum cinerariifolium]